MLAAAPRIPRIIRDVDHLEYLAQENARRDANRMILGVVSFVFFGASVGFFAAATQKTETKSSGHLWWKDETAVAIPTETRLAWLLGAILLMLVAFTVALILYRVSSGRAVGDGKDPRAAATSIATDRPSPTTSGHSKEFWIQTAIAILGLVITAVSAAAAWWA